MSNQIISVRTIPEWQALTDPMKVEILQNIRLKDRLHEWLKNRPKNPETFVNGEGKKFVPCVVCDKTGWEYKRDRNPGIHPSQLPHPCMLKIYNEMIGMHGVRRIEGRQQLIFDLGSAVHKMFQEYGKLGAWGPEYTAEVEITPREQEFASRYMIEGSVDADNVLPVDLPNRKITVELGIVHEYKTINSNNFRLLTGPKPEHQRQASIYSEALNRPVVVYMYLNKDDSNLVDFPVPYERSQWGLMEQKASALVNAYNSETPPEAAPGYHCQDCEYALNCAPYATYSSNRRRR